MHRGERYSRSSRKSRQIYPVGWGDLQADRSKTSRLLKARRALSFFSHCFVTMSIRSNHPYERGKRNGKNLIIEPDTTFLPYELIAVPTPAGCCQTGDLHHTSYDRYSEPPLSSSGTSQQTRSQNDLHGGLCHAQEQGFRPFLVLGFAYLPEAKEFVMKGLYLRTFSHGTKLPDFEQDCILVGVARNKLVGHLFQPRSTGPTRVSPSINYTGRLHVSLLSRLAHVRR